ncbi:hypothetical protein RJ639_006573 [Escallonia herrerae]|uniref:ABC transporter domain-containing protein n=1 Tax=Escallonia herrerae TaxID=1293975 RepID=A0AA88VXG8_9ASTE|nr:hypothetical protein RJ639_006573 [Escallonia herrerae]
MDQLTGSDEIESMKIELSEIGRTLSSPFQHRTCNCPSSSASSAANENADVKGARKWSEIEGLPTSKRLRSSSFDENDGDSGKRKRVVDVTKLGALERPDYGRVGVKMPAVEVRYKNLCLEAEGEDIAKLPGIKSKEDSITIMSDVSGIIKPGRLTLLLGPPGCRKTSLMKALSGNLDKALKMTGEVSYNGYKLEEFVPQKTSSYISQYDIHMPEITVRETLDFSARCQGVGNRAESPTCYRDHDDNRLNQGPVKILVEKLWSCLPFLMILGLDSCADSLVGDAMRRGVSSGQKRRLTTGAPKVKGYLTSSRSGIVIDVLAAAQLVIVAFIMMNVFLRRRMDVDVVHANYYLGTPFYSLVVLLVNGFPELSLTAARLPVFYKQRQLYFYPARAYTISATIVKIPLSLGISNILFHLTSISMYRFLASVFQTLAASRTAASISIWLKWGFWFSPLTYGEIGLTLNEFLAPRWHKVLPTKKTVGLEFLESRGLDFDEYYYWISLGALLALIIFFNLACTLALSFLNPPGSHAIISNEKLSQLQTSKKSASFVHVEEVSRNSPPNAVTEPYKGSLRPGVLTALMGVSGSGKTTLMDVLAGRKTSGTIEGEIRIGGYPKVQETFARISGYCEQTDEFVKEALELIELDRIKDSLVGIPGVNGLILLKTGGHVLYSGSLGQKSSRIIEYFEDIPGVPKIRNNCNPATWILDVTSTTAEAELDLDFAQLYYWGYCFGIKEGKCKRIKFRATVVSRERFAGMYGSWAYALAQVAIEVPYLLVESLAFVIITYPMIGYYWSAYKLSGDAACCGDTKLCDSCNPTVLHLDDVCPFLRRIPKWWLWLYYLTPTSWTLNGMLTSQYGDVDKEIMKIDPFALLVGSDEIDSLRIELSEIGRSLRSSFRRHTSCFRSNSALTSLKDDADDEYTLQWAAIDRLPTFERLKSSLFDEDGGEGASVKGKRVTDVTKLGALERHMFIEKLIKHIENDNLHLLQKLRKRISKVGVKLPTVEVRYKSLHVEAECEVVYGKPLPTLWNSVQSILYDMAKIPGLKSKEAKINIINDVSGIIKPGRMTLLLGPPGSGKTSLLKALSGNLNKSLKVAGEVSYNGYKLEEFVPQKISAYISQNDLHIPEMTVREALDFSARCQGVGSRAEIMREVSRREKEAGIVPDPDVDTYMKFYLFVIHKILEQLPVGLLGKKFNEDDEIAISVEGQKVTLQTDYTLKILGLDICADTLCGDAMRRGISGGQKKRLTTGEMIVGPTKALFMDEISSGLDSSTTYQIIACLQQLAHITDATVLVSLLQPAPESFDLFDDIILMAEGKIVYHGPRSQILEFFEGCGLRCPERKGVADFLQEVISRKDQAQYWHRTEQTHSYMSVDMLSRKFKESPLGNKLDEELSEPLMKSEDQKNDVSLSLFIIASITMTVFLRTRMDVDVVHANYYLGSLFYSLVILLVDGFPELSMTVARLSVFYKQRELYFYPAWAYAIPATLLKVPLSLVVALVWTSLTYYVIGYSPEAGRFFRQLVLLFAVHLTSISMYRFLASVFQTVVASTTAASMPIWLKWGFWVSPLTYGEIGLAVNEFLAPRWQKVSTTNTTIGKQTLESRGLDYNGQLFWISLGALFGFTIIFNMGFTLALTFLKRKEMRERGFTQKRLQLLGDITGSFRPGVLTALMGVSGAGKTTLLDVLSGRKTSGTIEGEIKIGGYPKVQETFARISGYCEQSDVHSPQITVEESVEFVKEVLETIELDGIKDELVGMPGVSGLSTEQRKRLTIAVELVANPSIIFMDEPTTGLDARAAAIVMRAVKNVVDTGRTIVCTIHQPSIDIFESFDELILLKAGGRIIYCGPLGLHSSRVIEYFEGIPGVSKIRDNYNPATWMLEITSASAEAELGIDFAEIYKTSALYGNNKELVKGLSTPPPGSKELNNQQSLFNIFGAMFAAVIFCGINNSSSVIPYVTTERSVLYRERFAGMYAAWAYGLAQVTIEIPYLFGQTLAFVVITYPMIGYYWSASKQVPKWWIWLYYLTPTSWTLNGMLSSQFGDIEKEIMVFGETKTISAFVKDYFGYNHDHLPIVAFVMILYPILFASVFTYAIGKLNFQRSSATMSPLRRRSSLHRHSIKEDLHSVASDLAVEPGDERCSTTKSVFSVATPSRKISTPSHQF